MRENVSFPNPLPFVLYFIDARWQEGQRWSRHFLAHSALLGHRRHSVSVSGASQEAGSWMQRLESTLADASDDAANVNTALLAHLRRELEEVLQSASPLHDKLDAALTLGTTSSCHELLDCRH